VFKRFISLKYHFLCFFQVILIYLLFNLKREAQAPYVASAFILIVSFFKKKTRLNWKGIYDLLVSSGNVLTELIAVLAGVGLIMGGLSMTGVVVSFTSELVNLVGGNVFLMLLIGAVVCYILGMGMIGTAAYIFLATVLIPALSHSGFVPMTLHLFVLYCSLFAVITPPVALGAYVAAVIGEADFWKTGFQSMRLGFVKYLVPFFFVYDPALILYGDPFVVFVKVIKSFLGVWILGSAIEGYLIGVGKLNIIQRSIYLFAGLLIFFPGWVTDLVGSIVFVIIFSLDLIRKRFKTKLTA
jgi:TRAP-type uncharacterized transport system fused permease subunit